MSCKKLVYPNGDEIKRGDKVKFEDGAYIGVIEDVINSDEKRKHWNIQEFGIMIKEEKVFGRVFFSEKNISEWGNTFVRLIGN